MSEHELVARGICEVLGTGPALVLGPPTLLEHLARLTTDRTDPTLLVSPHRTRKLRRLAPCRRVLRAAIEQLPVADGGLGALALADVLSCIADAEAALCCWRRVLRPRGQLALAERLSVNPALRALTRGRRAPEDLTGMLLNAGFVSIRQSWTRPHGTVITTARLAPF